MMRRMVRMIRRIIAITVFAMLSQEAQQLAVGEILEDKVIRLCEDGANNNNKKMLINDKIFFCLFRQDGIIEANVTIFGTASK